MNILLCGLPTCGKSSVGALIAQKLKWPFLDTDKMVETAYFNATGKQWTCREISKAEGEPFFRTLEKQQIAALVSVQKHVIATGGGSLIDPDNTHVLQSIGTLIYLKADPAELWKRHSNRAGATYLDPLQPESSFYALAQKRMALYVAAADIEIITEKKSPENIVDQILQLVQLHSIVI
jgi:shikimate kinase